MQGNKPYSETLRLLNEAWLVAPKGMSRDISDTICMLEERYEEDLEKEGYFEQH